MIVSPTVAEERVSRAEEAMVKVPKKDCGDDNTGERSRRMSTVS